MHQMRRARAAREKRLCLLARHLTAPDRTRRMTMSKQVKDILKRALEGAKEQIPSEEITYTEMMENLAHARRQAERKDHKPE